MTRHFFMFLKHHYIKHNFMLILNFHILVVKIKNL